VNLLRFGLATLVFLALAWGKSYSLEHVEQDVYLQADGLVRVVDVRTWRFDGAFREVFLEIDPRQGGAVRFEEARALDDGRRSAHPVRSTGQPHQPYRRPLPAEHPGRSPMGRGTDDERGAGGHRFYDLRFSGIWSTEALEATEVAKC